MLVCGCNEFYACPKCNLCFRCKHRSYFGDRGWFWLCPRRVKGPWRAHPPYEPYDPESFLTVPVDGNVAPAGVYGGIIT